MLCDRPAHILLLPCKHHNVNWHCCTSSKTGVPSPAASDAEQTEKKTQHKGSTVLHLRKGFLSWATQPA